MELHVPQRHSLVIAWLSLGLVSCATAGPSRSGAEPDPGEGAAPPAAEVPEPGVEARPAASRAGIDVLAYRLRIDLSDLERTPSPDSFRGDASLTLLLAPRREWIELDFAGPDIASVEVGGQRVPFRREGALLRIGPLVPESAQRRLEVRIRYAGPPRDGLFFGTDTDGAPTAFADNWPNRARWWFPGNDHPSDKASVRFEVSAPGAHEVIANGRLLEVREENGARTWIWQTDPRAPIPTYTMVIGVARFERRELGAAACGGTHEGASECVDVSVWALSGNGDYGSERFARAPDMLDFYVGLVGPYPYEKLAHVQSSTRFGGMENASAIFYARGRWESREMGEGVIAHETAHQWFGDAVTPASWPHLWVSEGFASYFGPLYFEARDGAEAFRARMEAARREILESEVLSRAVVDSAPRRLFDLLNTNSYEKGAWVLHMLRGLVGETAFRRAVRDYYRRHAHRTATTEDVREAFERASGRDLSGFFRQWLYSPGLPRLEVRWWPDAGDLLVAVRQTQPSGWPAFVLSPEIEVTRADGGRPRRTLVLAARIDTLRFRGLGDATDLRLDPDGWLLLDADVRRVP